MKIAEGIDVRLGIFDIETIVGMFDCGIYDVDKKEWIEFEISAYKNDLYKFVKYYTENDKFDYWVSYNGISFDHQVLQYIVDKNQEWSDLTGEEIAGKIAEFGSRIIDDQKYKLPATYKEWNFPVKTLDLMRIHHFDNEAKRTSLKWCEYMFNMDVEEMPIHHTQSVLSEKDREEVIRYRRHDVLATFGLLYLTLGDVNALKQLLFDEFKIETNLKELKDYQSKNKVQDRFDVMTETGMDCLNWSDVKIGEEWNKLDYINAENIKDQSVLFKRKVKYPYGQPFSNFFPSTMVFKTKKFQDFAEFLGKEIVKRDIRIKGTNRYKKQEFPFVVGKTTYTIAKGGLHSNEKNRTIKADKGYRYTDIDVGSQYPNSIVKLGIYAPSLTSTILEQFKGKIKRRFVYKDKANELKAAGKKEEARPFSSVQEMLKLCLNGGYYGKLGQDGSFLEYPEGLLKVCMSNQMEILMLVEMMEMNDITVLSGNTDGITCYYRDSQHERFLEVCKEWEVAVGNFEMGKLEHTEFEAVWQDNINHYLAKKIKTDKVGNILKDEEGKPISDGIKKKGTFLTEFQLNNNKSSRIIALALEAYFVDGKNPIEFITNHTDIFDFTIAKKAIGKMHYEELDGDNTIIHKKLIRYYACTTGNVIKKRGLNNKDQEVDSYCEAPSRKYPWLDEPKLKYFNRYEKKDNYDIDYRFYILKTLERIDKLSNTNMALNYANEFKIKQLSLF